MIKLYGKTLFFKKGAFVSIFPSFKCNLSCPYCVLTFPSGSYPHSEEMTFYQWVYLISRLEFKIKEFSISGGEPAIYPYLPELVNWLLEMGYHVKIYTNLTDIKSLLKIEKSHRLLIRATYHKAVPIERFRANYKEVKKKHRIDVYELGEKLFKFSIITPMLKEPKETENLCIAPDGELFIGCPSMAFKKSINDNNTKHN